MLYSGLDLSRKRLDFHLLDAEGATIEVGTSPPDSDGLRGLSERLARHGAPIRAAIESMMAAVNTSSTAIAGSMKRRYHQSLKTTYGR